MPSLHAYMYVCLGRGLLKVGEMEIPGRIAAAVKASRVDKSTLEGTGFKTHESGVSVVETLHFVRTFYYILCQRSHTSLS
jgi:hypothetical protein